MPWAVCFVRCHMVRFFVRLTLDFFHQRLEFINVFKTAVHAGKTDVRHLVELLELAHDQLTNVAGKHLTLPQVEQLFLDALDGRVNLLGADRAFAQRQHERAAQLGAVVVGAAAVLLDDGGEADVGPLVGGEALAAVRALAAADEVPVRIGNSTDNG